MLRKLLSTVLFMAFFVPAAALAQTGSIEGTVTDAETGDTIPGANVFLVEISRGAATDAEGHYEIDNVEPGTYTLRVTFVGYSTFTEQVTVSANETLQNDIQLQIGSVGLDEVVVTGYGMTQKRELTGSISSVSANEIEDVPATSVNALLQGRAAGVTITATSGNPGGAFQVNIRGNGSINAASQPLYIIDGVQVSFSAQSGLASTSPLNALNPSDILSIEVLKDAASAAIYGSQAASGVVIITTKQGRAGETQVTVRAETGITQAAEMPEYLSTSQYLDYMGEAYAHESGLSFDEARQDYKDFFVGRFGTPGRDGTLANTDWQDFIYRQGVSRSYYASVSGGNEKTTFFLSGGVEDTDGHVFNSSFDNLTLNTSLDHQISERFDIGLNLKLANYQQFGVCQDGNFVNCPISQAMFEPPMTFPYYDDGEYGASVLGPVAWNPAVIKEEVERNVNVLSIISNLRMAYEINDWLGLSGSLGVDYRNSQDERWETPIADPGDTPGSLAYDYLTLNNYMANILLRGSRTLNEDHTVSGFVGAEYRRNYWYEIETTGEGFPGSFFKVLDASSTPTQASGSSTEYRLGSYFGNLKYNYQDKYFLSLVGRYDGHSRFGTETRWGFFPSVSGAWRITEEDFFNVDVISELKLRAGYGTTGNSGGTQLANFVAQGLYSVSGSYQGQTGLVPDQLANVNLSWEKAREINIGLDFGLFNGRLSGSVDVYRKDNENLLLYRELPAESGYDEILENVGSVRNEGIEIEINTVNINTSDFLWSTRFNTAFMDNEVLDLGEKEVINEDATFQEIRVGQEIGIIQVPRWAGVNPADGRPMWYDAEGNITYTPNDIDDSIIYKDGLAEVVGGLGNTFRYKGLSLDVFFQFSFGKWAFGNTDYYFNRTPDFLMNLDTIVLNRWQQPGDITFFPRAATSGTVYQETANYRTTLGTQSIHNASYIRLKSITLSYNLPASIAEKLHLGGVRFFASGYNLHTWTAWPYYDPEVADDIDDIYGNLVAASYPVGVRINAGIEIKF